MLKTLILIRLRALFASFFTLGQNKKRRSPLAKVGIAVLAVYVVAVLLASVSMLFLSLAKGFCGTEYDWLYFAMASLIAVLFCFIGSVFVTQSTLFEAKDNDLLLSMPIPAGYILLSRFVSVFLLNFMYSLLMFLPAGFMYFKKEGFDPVRFVLFVAAFLLSATFATVLSCIFGWISALISSKMRKKSIVQTVFMFAFLVLYFVVYFNFQKYLIAIEENAPLIAEFIKKFLPLFYCLGVGISQKNYLYFFVFVLVSLLSFVAVYIVLSRTFFRVVTTKRSAAKVKYVKKEMKTSSKRTALVRKELSCFLSNTMYLMNCGLGSLFSVLLAVLVCVKGADFFAMVGFMTSEGSLVTVIVCSAFCFCAATTNLTAPSISLEGKNFPLLKSMPLTAREVFDAKILANLAVGAVPITLSALVSAIALGCGAVTSVAMAFVPLSFLVLTSVFGLAANVMFPKFDWINPTVIIKQSASVMISVLGGLAFVTLQSVLFVALEGVVSVNLCLVCAGGIYLALSCAVYMWLIKKGSVLFDKM